MKDVRIAFGRQGLIVPVPDDAVVVTGTAIPPLADERRAVVDALRSPLAGRRLSEIVGPGHSVVVVFPDITRPMPNRTVLPPLLEELQNLGAGPDRVQLLCATGTHRSATDSEMLELVGPEVFGSYAVHQHDAQSAGHTNVGDLDSTPVLLDSRYVEADVRIVTGFVEPHFFAGFSGGPKGVFPGLGALETILEAHSRSRIADPMATWLVTKGNPVHDFVRRAVALAPPTLSVDVTIDAHRRLTGVFAAPLPVGHEAACAFVARTAVEKVPGRFDVVLSTNGGHPLDRNLYQAVKGLAAAQRVVCEGGVIVMAAECVDGVPSAGGFAQILSESEGGGPQALRSGGSSDTESALNSSGTRPPAVLDGWQAQVLGRVLQSSKVRFYSHGLSDSEIRMAQMEPVADLASAVAEALGSAGTASRLCVLPEGPLTVATAVT
ncbi:MAG TPA: nickel-dependent lactate racemase [Acidimicrobiales bacterium]|nr:nickel-dependent lactate racemase [Acidimicrobiales bacterium]